MSPPEVLAVMDQRGNDMGNLKGLFSSATDLWATPQAFFDKLNTEFGFTLDPCALPTNAKCEKFYTPDDNGLTKDWGGRKCFAIRRMAERFTIGCVSVVKNQESPIRLS